MRTIRSGVLAAVCLLGTVLGSVVPATVVTATVAGAEPGKLTVKFNQPGALFSVSFRQSASQGEDYGNGKIDGDGSGSRTI